MTAGMWSHALALLAGVGLGITGTILYLWARAVDDASKGDRP